MVLGYSRLMWLQFYRRQTMEVLIRGLESAFAFFGGVPAELLFDQMKAVIVDDQRDDGGRLLENAEFVRFAAHWGFRVRACRPYRAKTKGKVERPISYVRQNFFYGRSFLNDADLNAQALSWLQQVANVRRHRTTGERPQLRFDRDERGLLQAAWLSARIDPGCYRMTHLDTRRVSSDPPPSNGARWRCMDNCCGELVKSASQRDQIRAMLADLKLPGAFEAVDGILATVDGGSVTASEAIARLLVAQISLRNNRRLAAAMRSSRLPAVKTLETFDFSFQPSIKRDQIESLHELGFVERKENVVLLGPPGVGKTHLAISLAIAAAQHGRRVYYGTLVDLITSLEEAQAAGQLRAPAGGPQVPIAAGRRRDRLLADQPQRCRAVLPAHEPPLRTRIDRADVEQGLRGMGRGAR